MGDVLDVDNGSALLRVTAVTSRWVANSSMRVPGVCRVQAMLRALPEIRRRDYCMLTVTLRRDLPGLSDAEVAWEVARSRRWVGKCMAALQARAGVRAYVAFVEFQTDGFAHWHILCLGVRRIEHAVAADCWRHGFVWVSAASDRKLEYCSKLVSYSGKGASYPAWFLNRPVRTTRTWSASKGLFPCRSVSVSQQAPMKPPNAYEPIWMFVERTGGNQRCVLETAGGEMAHVGMAWFEMFRLLHMCGVLADDGGHGRGRSLWEVDRRALTLALARAVGEVKWFRPRGSGGAAAQRPAASLDSCRTLFRGGRVMVSAFVKFSPAAAGVLPACRGSTTPFRGWASVVAGLFGGRVMRWFLGLLLVLLASGVASAAPPAGYPGDVTGSITSPSSGVHSLAGTWDDGAGGYGVSGLDVGGSGMGSAYLVYESGSMWFFQVYDDSGEYDVDMSWDGVSSFDLAGVFDGVGGTGYSGNFPVAPVVVPEPMAVGFLLPALLLLARRSQTGSMPR